jgi:hypothetical protein
MIAPMNVAKCAFAATKLSEKLVFVCGGYDGNSRVDTMEIYDVDLDVWSIINQKLDVKMSNSACCSPNSKEVIILGGGTNQGFSKEVYKFNIDTGEMDICTKMENGRDLRNKVILLNNQVYTIGVSDSLLCSEV